MADEVEYDYEQQDDAVDQGVTQVKPTGLYSGVHLTGFKDFFLKPAITRAIQDAGFEAPSEVQHQCIPDAVHHKDILCQARAGMGKTAVFVIAVLQQMDDEEERTGAIECMCIAHTKELVYQIKAEFDRFSKHMKNVRTAEFFGGRMEEDDKMRLKSDKPNIAIGCPGRMKALTLNGAFDLSKLRFFILDECDHLLKTREMRDDVQKIFLKTPKEKQVMMFSATMPTEMRLTAKKFMKDPKEIYVDSESKLTLHGLTQYFVKVLEKDKNRKLHEILDDVNFNQVVIFVSQVKRAQFLCKLLKEFDFPAVAIYGRGMEQKERLKVYDDFKAGKGGRILVATDLFGRGIDIERVNVVINYDMTTDTPEKCGTDQYLHRVGRAGRFGTRGLAITFLSTDEEIEVMNQVQTRFEVQVNELTDPKSIPESAYKS
jgi:ATP-dependent RNA helicase UAP56/SUB2